MKLFSTLCFIGATTFSLTAQNVWVAKDTVNGSPRSVASAMTINGEGYILAGLDNDGFRRKVHSYTYWQDDWDAEESIGGPSGDGLDRGSACAFSINNKGYICLGQGETNPYFGDLWELDPATDAWTQKANFIGGPRRQAVSFVVNGIAYVGTGIGATGMKKDMYSYDPVTNYWTQKNDFGGTARKEAVGFSMGNQGYIGTGDDGVMRKDFWQYEPATDTWTEKASFPGSSRKGAVGWGQFPSGFICLGEDFAFDYKNDLWEYNYYADAWQQRADFPAAGRSNAVVFLVNDLAFVGTGFNGQFFNDLYAYNRIVGLDENQLNLNVSVYPNPAKEKVTIEVENDDLEISIVSSDGKIVQTKDQMHKTSTGYVLYRNNLKAGTYFAYFSEPKSGRVHTETIIFVE